MIEPIIFWTFALIAVGGALGVVLHRSILYSALFLIATFLSIAAFFVLNNADFLAVAQTVVYAVGLTIVMLFGIMFTGQLPFAKRTDGKTVSLAPPVAVFIFLTLLAAVALSAFVLFPVGDLLPQTVLELTKEGTTKMLGKLLFSSYVFPFELASVLLLVAMMGAIVISKRELDGDVVMTHVAVEPDETGALACALNANSDASSDSVQGDSQARILTTV
ncbi:MAG: NADH-quinone oxidoreductase subunit J [Vampirovibrionales bacterium]|nr:NADH-quinone oxidoreductase subunit J [Vampirovibrionales bacterium]